jgi:osmotically-inducible protein OsmY
VTTLAALICLNARRLAFGSSADGELKSNRFLGGFDPTGFFARLSCKDRHCNAAEFLESIMSVDSQLQQAVLAELNWQPGVGAGHIGVTAENGIVTLTGHVENYPHKHAAELAARRVKGVLAVADEITVELPVNTGKTDAEIAAAAIERLAWNVSLPRDGIQVGVADGWVTLTGAVEWYYQSLDAVQEIHALRGVVGVSNEIAIKPRLNCDHVARDISFALNRAWFVDKETITVTAEGGEICLTGTVHSPQERELAALTAWSAPGVTAVRNDLVVV